MQELTIKDFLDAGYREYKDITKPTDRFVQKAFWDSDGEGKLYFINVYNFKVGTYSGFQANAQFTRKGVTLNIELLDVFSVNQVEEFFDDVWNTLKCDRYDK